MCIVALGSMLGMFGIAALIAPDRTSTPTTTRVQSDSLRMDPAGEWEQSLTGTPKKRDTSEPYATAPNAVSPRDHSSSGGEVSGDTVTAEHATQPKEWRGWYVQVNRVIEPLAKWIVAVWVLGILILGPWHLGGLIAIYRMRSVGTKPVPADLIDLVEALGKRMNVRRPVALYESMLVQSPVVIGWIKPVVLLPASVLTRMTPQQIEVILAHELAHVRRHDYLINLVQLLIVTLLFYHPAVWWVSQQICREREYCCDDIVVRTTSRKLDYAKTLAQIAERQSPMLQDFALGAADGSVLDRIRRIAGLDETSGISPKTWFVGLILIALMAATPAGLIAWNAQAGRVESNQPITAAQADKQPQDATTQPESKTAIEAEADEVEEDHSEPAEQPPMEVQAGQPLTLAVLGFEAPGDTDGGTASMINDTIEVLLSAEGRFQIVDRSSIEKTLQEQAVNLSGVTDTNEAINIGRVTGAKILVTGKAFELGESRIVTAKLIGSETTKVKAVMAQGELDVPLDKLVFEAAQKLVAELNRSGHNLVASPMPPDPIPGLIAQLKGVKLPVTAIVIPEEHRRATQPIAPPDPAVETELKKLLIQAGGEVRDVKDNALADWVRQYEEGENPAWPRTLEGVEVVIIGEAFSESAGRMGQLQLASARAEINLITRKQGRVIHADRSTTRAVDLAEEVAGKTALEKAGRVLGERVLRLMATKYKPQ